MIKQDRLVSKDIIKQSGIEFGTSGARGLVVDFTPDVCFAFTYAFVAVMRSSYRFNQVALAIDNRPSSYDMAMACATALKAMGLEPVYYGVIPTPALAYKSMNDAIPCIMVTGSHIPFDRNGLKFYRPDGEITKSDELAIISVEETFSVASKLLCLEPKGDAAAAYIARYSSLFEKPPLAGMRLGIYEHSSAGRDLYAVLFKVLGAEVISLERTEDFVPIDTEAVSEADQDKARGWSQLHKLDAIFSTDGDGDRPLVADEVGNWLRGDILGLLCAANLGVEAVAIPVSCNSAVSSCGKFANVTHTKIGSPYVLEAFPKLNAQYGSVAGFEANGGFLLGSMVEFNGKRLAPLPTRDAVLPALILFVSAQASKISVLIDELPQRFTYSDRIKDFPKEKSKEIIELGTANITELMLKLHFNELQITSVDRTDGLRVIFGGGEVLHLRPSGNAPELRCYAESDSVEGAKSIVNQSLGYLQK
ncbi:phosphomannomutase [Aeromonas piscicola]|jgi:phosphomannomutase|uniref:Phosphomannomutase n=1 Tax=Aeromonas piscicola TaxID=600645 RepID=A0ABT7QDG4_9GAMM|nr:phosphomannomutase [Aeromonas piscicola]MDM5131991.1 phosphomannomutase [Aeromonas piscicola]